MKKLSDMLLVNDNINENDIGKKGLHLNGQGTRKMAGNIILLIKRF